jgi:hypothetical protein
LLAADREFCYIPLIRILRDQQSWRRIGSQTGEFLDVNHDARIFP